MLSDCHVHLASYDSHELRGIVRRANEANVTIIITAGSTYETSLAGIDLAKSHDIIYASVGIHPMRLRGYLQQEDYQALEQLATTHPKVIAWSETGMDYLPNAPDHKWQEQAFREQIRLARIAKLPLIWHSQVPEPNLAHRHPETLRILNEEHAGDLGGIMHYFQADEATARAAIESGFFVSFAKPLLRQPHLTEVARKIPLEHIVLETDASPQPWKSHRSDWTEPKDVALVAQKLATIKGVSVEQVAEVTTQNLMKLVALDK